jgi:hypothetical protein
MEVQVVRDGSADTADTRLRTTERVERVADRLINLASSFQRRVFISICAIAFDGTSPSTITSIKLPPIAGPGSNFLELLREAEELLIPDDLFVLPSIKLTLNDFSIRNISPTEVWASSL